MNIYIIITIIFIVILSVSLYFGLRPINKPSLPLSSNTCKNNLTQCGTGCYDKKWQSCDSEKQICDSQNFSQENNQCCISPKTLHEKIQIDSKGNQKIVGTECCKDEYWSSSGNTCCPNPVCGGFCCENTKYCDYNIVDDNEKNHKNNNPCKVCPYDLCGQNCCKSNEKCFTGPSGLISCCLPQLWDPDKKICCNGSTGALIGINCHPGGNPKCNPSCNSQETCIAENVCCDDVYDANDKIYNCVDQDFNSICCPKDDIKDKCQLLKNGRYICCDNGFSLDEKSQKCFQICGNEKCDPELSACVGTDNFKYCQTKGCVWDTKSDYNPPNYGDNIIFSYKNPDKTITKYYYANPTNSDISNNLQRTITYTEIDKDNKCTKEDCTGKISEDGGSITFNIENHQCVGSFNSKDIKDFPYADSEPATPCPSEGSCVKDVKGNLTGQICLNSKGTPQQSYNGPDATLPNNTKLTLGDCICNENDDQIIDTCKIFNKKTCNNYGNPDYINGICNCDSTYFGNYCQYSRKNTCSDNGMVNSEGICRCDPGYYNNNCNVYKNINWRIIVNSKIYDCILNPNVLTNISTGDINGTIKLINNNMFITYHIDKNTGNLIIDDISGNNIESSIFVPNQIFTYLEDTKRFNAYFQDGPRYSINADMFAI